MRGINLDGSGNPVPSASQGDLFSYKLDYETAGFYNGNIGKQYWQASTNNTPTGIRTYTFTYDAASRLKSAAYTGNGTENYTLPTVNYDKNGNITSLQRNGRLASAFGLMDNLTYTYAGNRLMRVEDAISGDYDVDFVNRNSGSDDYSYYANGALKSDKNEAINDIIYNTYANKPAELQLSSSRWIKNLYDGVDRLYKTTYSTGEYWEYLDGLVFKNGTLYQLATPEGRAVYQSGTWSYEYFHTDNLGNTRVAYKATGTALTKTSETSFDPWGIVLRDAGLVNSFQNRFEYQNKEKESTFNLRRIDFGARSYNGSIGRFDKVDPSSGNRQNLPLSGYHYVTNNPVLNIDPDGRDWYTYQGEIQWMDRSDKQFKDSDDHKWRNIGTELLKFDGKSLTYFWQNTDSDGKRSVSSISFQAVSGKGTDATGYWNQTRSFDYSIDRQMKANLGPTPEGLYSISKKAFVEGKNESGFQRFDDLNPIKQVAASFGVTNWPGGTSSWGNYRWKLQNEGAETYGRKNFYLHGGAVWGSRGCIDCGGGIGTFAQKFLETRLGNNKVFLQVQYPASLNYEIQNSPTDQPINFIKK